MVLSSVAHGIPVDAHSAMFGLAPNIAETKPVEQPKDTAAIMSAKDQRDRNVAIGIGARTGIAAGIVAGIVTAAAFLFASPQNRLGEMKQRIAKYEAQNEEIWEYAEYNSPSRSSILTKISKIIQEQPMFERNLRNKYPSVDPAEFDHLFHGYRVMRDHFAHGKRRSSIDLNERESAARASRNMPPQ